MKERNIRRGMILIFSEDLEVIPKPYHDVAKAFFLIDIKLTGSLNFDEYLSNWTLKENGKNVWFPRYLQETCDLQNGTDFKNCSRRAVGSLSRYVNDTMSARIIDCVYTFAHALHSFIRDVCPNAFIDKTASGECFDRELYLEYIRNTSFRGQSGNIRFDRKGDLIGQYQIRQLASIASDDEEEIGVWDMMTSQLTIDTALLFWNRRNNTSTPKSVCSKPCRLGHYVVKTKISCCWGCFKCPKHKILSQNGKGIPCNSCPAFTWPAQRYFNECVAIKPLYMDMNDPSSVVFAALSVIGILSTITVIAIFIKHRNTKIVKASSLDLNIITLIGVLLAFWTVFPLVAKPNDASCIIGRYGFNLSFVFVYATMVTKVIRVYRIFQSGQAGNQRPRFVNRASQLVIVSVLIILQVSITSYALLQSAIRPEGG